MIIHTIQRWEAVNLVALEAESGEPFPERAALALVFETVHPSEVWNLDAILKNWRWRMNERYVRAGKRASQASLAHTDPIDGWLKQTRSIANDLRVVYGDRLAGVLEHAASELEQAVTWPQLRINKPPRDQKGLANLFLTVDLWAHDRVRDTLEALCRNTAGIPGKDAGRTKLLAASIHELQASGLDHMKSDEGWKMRVRRLQVRAGEEDRLVADVLDACRSGPYDQNGREVVA